DAGLVSNAIISIYADSDSSIWVVTENDISRFDGKKWVNHILPASMSLDFEGGNFLRSNDGICWVNKSPREWKRRALSYSQLPPSGIGRYICYRYQPDKNPPETRFLDYPNEVPSEGNVVLNWQGHDYLNFTKKENLEYSYRIDRGEWSEFSAESRHLFTDLSGGKHLVEVKARDQDFNVDPTPARIEFRVQIPLWRQPVFLGFLLFFLFMLAVFVYIIIVKNQTLSKLNHNLRDANQELQERGHQILKQNQHILDQQEQIIEQKDRLELANLDLANSHSQIEQQRDALKKVVSQVKDLSKTKLDFFTNISHELRTPLSLLIGPIDQLVKGHREMTVQQREEFLQVSNRNANRLLILINQLLEFRKIENSALDSSPQPGNLIQTVEATMSLFQNLAKTRRLHLSLENSLPQPWFIFDKDKIEKILANLLSNAFKHTPNHGHVYLSLEKVILEAENSQLPDPRLRICVVDDGNGIPAEDLNHIFDRYYTASTGNHFSTGIGMSYIRELVKLQEGEIYLESEEGVGTMITIDLPFRPCSEKDVDSSQQESSNLAEANLHIASLSAEYDEAKQSTVKEGSKSVLIVEDHADMRKFVISLLAPDYRILEAEEGKKGLEIARAQSPDLIISDISMPEMDGLTFCKLIKEDLLTSHIPLILLTAKTQPTSKMEGYLQGADDYITKPFKPEMLKVRVQNLLEQREQLRKKYQQQVLLKPKTVELESPDEKLLASLSQLMEDNIDDPEFNVNKMCKALGYSHIQFIRKIKQLTGKKPLELLRSFRLARSRDLLSQKKLTISEVGYLVGYDLPNSFSRAFRKEFGVSPTEFLEKEC
ncbi:MAG: response regulator, partial [Bacteroidetes bacterium]|nr:response regulator [Bacteroidota bacterium]